jgi:hypothetical protein
MVVRLLLILVVAFALGATVTSVSADVASVVVELDGETTVDIDEVQVAAGEVDSSADDHALTHAAPDATAPVPPFRHGVFRPPRVAFD